MRLFGLLLLVSTAAWSQVLSFGLKVGAPVTDVVKSESWKYGSYDPSSGRYLLGPMVEVHLPFRLSVEFDALYRPVKYRVRSTVLGSVSEASGGAWVFPVLAKYRFSGGLVSPYIAGGMAFNRLSGLKELGDLADASADGFVAGMGLEGKLPFLRIAPEIRYTRWRSDNLRHLAGGFGLSNRNQLEALVGITF